MGIEDIVMEYKMANQIFGLVFSLWSVSGAVRSNVHWVFSCWSLFFFGKGQLSIGTGSEEYRVRS